ncbi:MAG TPA: hypothetical protein VN890_10830 [Methylocella sp.]|nr:hypothetical protein [Methylocella sp.]
MTGTKRIEGRVTASDCFRVVVVVLVRLTWAFTISGGMSFTSCPSAPRVQWCAVA